MERRQWLKAGAPLRYRFVQNRRKYRSPGERAAWGVVELFFWQLWRKSEFSILESLIFTLLHRYIPLNSKKKNEVKILSNEVSFEFSWQINTCDCHGILNWLGIRIFQIRIKRNLHGPTLENLNCSSFKKKQFCGDIRAWTTATRSTRHWIVWSESLVNQLGRKPSKTAALSLCKQWMRGCFQRQNEERECQNNERMKK